MRRNLLCLVFCCVAIVVLTGCPSKPVLELHSVSFTGATPQGVGVNVAMRVNNDNPFDVKIRNVRANVVFADRFRLPPMQHNPDQWLGAGQWTVVNAPMIVPWNLVGPLMSYTARSQTVSYRVTGLADVTAVRLLGIKRNDHELDEQGEVNRVQLVFAAARGALGQ